MSQCSIVGAHYRPPAKAILQCLPSGAALILRPEPTNQFDANAIMVICPTSSIPESQHEELELHAAGHGFSLDEILSKTEHHVGYIPKELAANIKLPGDTPATLAFNMKGSPQVAWEHEGA